MLYLKFQHLLGLYQIYLFNCCQYVWTTIRSLAIWASTCIFRWIFICCCIVFIGSCLFRRITTTSLFGRIVQTFLGWGPTLQLSASKYSGSSNSSRSGARSSLVLSNPRIFLNFPTIQSIFQQSHNLSWEQICDPLKGSVSKEGVNHRKIQRSLQIVVTPNHLSSKFESSQFVRN